MQLGKAKMQWLRIHPLPPSKRLVHTHGAFLFSFYLQNSNDYVILYLYVPSHINFNEYPTIYREEHI